MALRALPVSDFSPLKGLIQNLHYLDVSYTKLKKEQYLSMRKGMPRDSNAYWHP